MALSSTSFLSPLSTTDYYSQIKPLLHFHSSSSSHFPTRPLIHHNNTNNLASISHKWRTNVSFFPAFLKKGKDANTIKEELLEAIAPLDRGAEATPEDQQRIDQVAFYIYIYIYIYIYALLSATFIYICFAFLFVHEIHSFLNRLHANLKQLIQQRSHSNLIYWMENGSFYTLPLSQFCKLR
jgi:hypothetical protein